MGNRAHLFATATIGVGWQVLQTLPHLLSGQTFGNLLAFAATSLTISCHQTGDRELTLMRQSDLFFGLVAWWWPTASHAQFLQPTDWIAVDFPLSLVPTANGKRL